MPDQLRLQMRLQYREANWQDVMAHCLVCGACCGCICMIFTTIGCRKNVLACYGLQAKSAAQETAQQVQHTGLGM